MVTPAAKRRAVARLKDAFGMSERRACKAIGCCRMTVRYETSRTGRRRSPRAHEGDRAGTAPVWLRRFLVMLRREGLVGNHKKLFRLYREEKLAVRRRGGCKRAIGTRAPLLVPLRADERWLLDFVSGTLTDGRRSASLRSSTTARANARHRSSTTRARANASPANSTSSPSIAATPA